VTEPSADPTVPLVLGIGNEHRGDDAVGLLIVRHLRSRLAGVATVAEVVGEGTELLDWWDGRRFVVAVDAVRAGLVPGAVVRWESGRGALPTSLGTVSSHGVSLGQAIALGDALDRRPEILVLYGIEGSNFAVGDPPSEAVLAALEPTSRRIEAEVRGRGALGRESAPRSRPDA